MTRVPKSLFRSRRRHGYSEAMIEAAKSLTPGTLAIAAMARS
jgi:hypothetical protein